MVHNDTYVLCTTVEPPNKGHIGDNINSAVLSFIERLSSFRGFQRIKTMAEAIDTTVGVDYGHKYVACNHTYIRILLVFGVATE